MRRGALAVFGLAVVVMVVVAPAGAASHDAGAVCQEYANNMVLTVQNDGNFTGSASLYPGTNAHVTFCTEGEPASTTTWNITDDAGVEIVSDDENAYTVSLPDDRAEVVLNEETIDGRPPPDSLTITLDHGTASSLDIAADGLRFDRTTAENFEGAADGYQTARATLSAELEALDRTTETLRADGRTAFTSGNGSTVITSLSAVNESVSAIYDNASAMKRILFTSATNPLLPSDAYVASLETVDRRTSELNTTILDTLEPYRSALTSVGSSAKGTILQTTGIGFVVGLVVGGILGAIPVFRAGRKVRDFSDFRGTDFDKSRLRIPVAVGLGIVILGLGALVFTGIGGALL